MNYHIEEPPEKALSWEAYEGGITKDWDILLNGEPSSEAAIQAFLEKHPSMVPGAFGLSGGESGHYPWPSSLISQPPLPSYNHRIPDFMWLSQWSDTEQPVLIEIEAPSKRWFTRSGTPTADFTQAMNQIAEWKAWFAVPHNIQAFKEFYGLDREAWRRRRFRPAYLLIYGRRAEASADPTLTQKRGIIYGDDVTSMTYDRLRPNPKTMDLICVKVDGPMAFHALSVPATLTWSPSLAEERALMSGLDDAIEANPYISQQRKQFLIRRLPYWNEWGRRRQEGFIRAIYRSVAGVAGLSKPGVSIGRRNGLERCLQGSVERLSRPRLGISQCCLQFTPRLLDRIVVRRVRR